ncbi:patatin : Patatin OS=Cyanothece sp. (strain PCC 7424) GN=PCC7424_5594 PE=4 SV=1: Patatin [Tuwongella immobilis]|uniref:PNPLA domain-containing protein n=2 Tax=Tuwongella immobilis TaxID=692036 RepID=A0A6C2YJD1_9BACT|nr:patatin : Patatin OS=Cyanothece sp. (strain PCC 7424) GN=PCC7424_5594 PE=4 SV=1: Patatin [Tuwongella immobilis]VTR97569.1 patatin : Patatin OS=Cyanothece sp. (strain PCC 7424) GN=PCC7424_5594 PE=4 SV=1: Patatin [Tuwongella immobilis]
MGTYTAAMLAELERMTGKRLWEYFDLITGTSTGGIIAVALGLGIPAERILRLYLEQGARIFPFPRLWLLGHAWWTLKHVFRPKHSQQVLKQVIEDVVKDQRFGDSKVRLVIPAFDADRGGPQLFKTAHRPEFKQDYLLPAVTVALGTAAAPTYYPAYTAAGGGCYIDGGVWANCPAMIGLLEATCVLKQPIERVELLSIGTTTEPFHVSTRRRRGGILRWGKGAVRLFMQGQVEGAIGQARLMTNHRMLRVNNVTVPGRFTIDDATVVAELKSLGEQAARIYEREISQRFLFAPAPRFTPDLVPPARSAQT